jgi:hypothetical protein
LLRLQVTLASEALMHQSTQDDRLSAITSEPPLSAGSPREARLSDVGFTVAAGDDHHEVSK